VRVHLLLEHGQHVEGVAHRVEGDHPGDDFKNQRPVL
jgi:hypothetical protein